MTRSIVLSASVLLRAILQLYVVINEGVETMRASKMTATKAKTLKKPGRFNAGDTLYLLVSNTGAKSWVQRLVIHGRRCDIGLGGFRFVTLAEAREQAFKNQREARRGGDPVQDKRKAAVPTFRAAAEKPINLCGHDGATTRYPVTGCSSWSATPWRGWVRLELTVFGVKMSYRY